MPLATLLDRNKAFAATDAVAKNPQIRGCPHNQQLQLSQRVRVQFVHVIDHQLQPLVQRRQVAQQPLRQRPPVQLRRRRHRPHRSGPRARLDPCTRIWRSWNYRPPYGPAMYRAGRDH